MSRNYSLLMMEKPNVPSELATLVHFKYKQVYTEDKKSKDGGRANIARLLYIHVESRI